MKIGKVAKAPVAAAGIAYSAISDDIYSSTEIVNTVLAVLTVLGAYAVSNAEQPVRRTTDYSR